MIRRTLFVIFLAIALILPSTNAFLFARENTHIEVESRTRVTNDNSADVDNDVDVAGNTGDNEAGGGEGGAGGDGGDANGDGSGDARGADGAHGADGGSGGNIVTGAVETRVTICNDVNDSQTSVGGNTINEDDTECPEQRRTENARITVVKNVINDNGGTFTSRDFMIEISGTSFATSTFRGSATGTLIILPAGNFSIREVDLRGYEQTVSGNCSGSISSGQSITCTFTNNDRATSTPPTTGGGGGNNPPSGGGQSNPPPSGGGGSNPPPSSGGSTSNPMICIPAVRQVNPNEVATFTAIGGGAPYTWNFTGSPTINATATQATTSYAQLFLSYPTVGTQTVTVLSGDQAAICSLVVMPGQVLAEVITPPATGAGGEGTKNIALILLFGLLMPGVLFGMLKFMKKTTA